MNKVFTKLKRLVNRSVLLILVFFTSNLFAQTLTDDQKNALLPKIKLLLKDYEKFSQFSSDGVSLDKEYIKQFSALFEPVLRDGIFNDISPSKKGTFQTADQYVSFVKTNYPQGLDVKVEIDNLKILEGELVKGSYAISVLVHKKIAGIFNNQALYRFNDDLYFMFTSNIDEQGNPTNFSVNGILSKEKYAQVNDVKQKGIILSLGVGANYSKTKIYSSKIYSSDLWKSSTGSTFNPEIDLVVMFTKGFGLGTGIKLSSYNSSFDIHNYNQKSARVLTDIDGDQYNPVLNIPNLSQQNVIKSIDIPIVLKFVVGKRKTKFYLDIGVISSIIYKSYFTLSGSSIKAGYYEALNVTLTDIPEYGFGSYSYNKEKEYLFLKKKASSLSGYSSFGILYQLSSRLLFKLGAGLTYGLNDLNVDADNTDNFINITSPNPNEKFSLRSTGVELGFYYLIPSKR